MVATRSSCTDVRAAPVSLVAPTVKPTSNPAAAVSRSRSTSAFPHNSDGSSSDPDRTGDLPGRACDDVGMWARRGDPAGGAAEPGSALLDHLVAARLTGRVATPLASTRHNCARLVEGDPDYTFGLSDWRDATVDEVLAAVRAAGGVEATGDGDEDPAGGFIDPGATVEGIGRHRNTLASFVAAGGGRVLLATGHPSALLSHYGAVARALAAAGCEVLRPLDGAPLTGADGRREAIRYLDGVGALSFHGGLHHTHRPGPMEELLHAAGGAGGVDLVVADHGFAGAAIEAGIPTLSIADVNDPALPLAQARGRTDGVLLIDDGLDPSLFVPVTEAVLAGVEAARA